MEMDRRLYQASLRGDVDTLNNLIGENPHILERATVGRLNQTPLHIAASLGHLEFTRALLNLDSKHDSCENGHVEIVGVLGELLPADIGSDNSVCMLKDKEGRIPLHLAVMQGHVKVILELIAARPESTMVTLDKTEESVLHLCVKYNRLEALKLILDLAPRGQELVKYTDTEDNTVLHVGASLNQTEIIKYLLSIPEVIEIANDKNKKSFTALTESEEYSAIKHSTRMIIQDSLDKAGISGFEFEDDKLFRVLRFFKKYLFGIDDEWTKKFRGHLLMAGTLIATVTFQAGVALPGGVWQDGNKKGGPNSHEAPAPSPGDVNHDPGTSIIASEKWDIYNRFVLFNTFSFTASLVVILLLLSGIPLKKKFPMVTLNVAVFVSILFMAYTYYLSIVMITPRTEHRQSLLNRCYAETEIVFALFSFCFLRYYMFDVLMSYVERRARLKSRPSSWPTELESGPSMIQESGPATQRPVQV